ncbi:MAG: hypothetical protein KF851_05800 [Pirellulaceae bacterium]|nr:hypothetical protein [Pirellulaceae bacterium]
MTNLTNPRVIWLKGGLFVLLGMTACAILISQLPDWRFAVLLVIAIWAFCHAYYFAFYVIEHYVDPSFRFAGLIHFARYALCGHPPDKRD